MLTISSAEWEVMRVSGTTPFRFIYKKQIICFLTVKTLLGRKG